MKNDKTYKKLQESWKKMEEMPLNRIPNSTAIDTFINTNGRPPEVKNPKDVDEIENILKKNYINAMDTSGWEYSVRDEAKLAIINYWKNKRMTGKI